MSRLIADRAGLFTCEVEVHGPVLRRAMEHRLADEVLESAVAAALSVLAEDDPWLEQYLERLASFMLEMRAEVLSDS